MSLERLKKEREEFLEEQKKEYLKRAYEIVDQWERIYVRTGIESIFVDSYKKGIIERIMDVLEWREYDYKYEEIAHNIKKITIKGL